MHRDLIPGLWRCEHKSHDHSILLKYEALYTKLLTISQSLLKFCKLFRIIDIIITVPDGYGILSKVVKNSKTF
jgi:hypothetical protein